MQQDPLIPVFYDDETGVKLLDCSGIVNRWSFQAGVATRDGGNGGMMRDGSKTIDVLAYKLRHTWTFNAISSMTLGKLHTLAEMDYVTAEVFDHRQDKRRMGEFMIELPDPAYAFTTPAGQVMFQAGGTLILEEV